MSSYAATLDLSLLAKDLTKAAARADEEVDKVLADAAQQIKMSMLMLVPRRTGNLARSITIQASPGRYEIGPRGVDYAIFIEYGTKGPYEIKPKKADGVLAFTMGGRTVFAKSVIHPGIEAQPFVRPAAEAYVDSLGDKAADVGVDIITGKR